jgi:hypothetical protein
MVRVRVLISAALIAAAVPFAVFACGPFFEPEVFVPAQRPEKPALFATGQLGVLQPEYSRADKVVAFRYLQGGRLSAEEKAAYVSPSRQDDLVYGADQPELPVNQWLRARADFAKDDELHQTLNQNRTDETQMNGYVMRNEVLNCTDGSFINAKETLAARAKLWGRDSADLREWLNGQDKVFSNCADSGQIPQAAPATASALLHADRAYQIAAANFYAGNFDAAIAGFEAIGRDKASPWNRWGEYLAARAEVRKAAAVAEAPDSVGLAKFDLDLLQKASKRLQRVIDGSDPQMRHAAKAELAFVQVRLEPEIRLNDVAIALAGPAPDPDFAQHLTDLRFLAENGVKGDAELLHWMDAVSKDKALAGWKASGTLPWLVAALSSATGDGPETASLLGAAAKVPRESPAYVTVNYHRARLLLKDGNAAEARSIATGLLAGLNGQGMMATRNAVLGLRMQTAGSFAEFLADAPRTVIESSSQAAANARCYDRGGGKGLGPAGCIKDISPLQFDGDASRAFNQMIPLARWVEAANSPALPQQLRDGVALAVWVRAVGLDDAAIVRQIAPVLPEQIRETAGESTGFPATLAMLRNPGLHPYLQHGVQRSLSYHRLDDYRDNWWCERWSDGEIQQIDANGNPMKYPEAMQVNFLTQNEKSTAAEERDRLNALPGGVVWLGQRAIAYVKEHPDDKDGAEALGLTVRATRYGCFLEKDGDKKAVSKEAFTMLHRLYPKSDWAARTPYYY